MTGNLAELAILLEEATSSLEDIAMCDDFDRIEFQMVVGAIVGTCDEIVRICLAGAN